MAEIFSQNLDKGDKSWTFLDGSTKKAQKPERKLHRGGRLLVVTGKSGSGKDKAVEELIRHSFVRRLSYRRLVTCNFREKRPGEKNGVHYHFVDKEKLQEMYEKGELVEKPLLYGTSYKATPRSEFHEVMYKGERKIWRIDPSLAAKVATGEFFDEQFAPHESIFLKKFSAVVFITADTETLEKRRKDRDRGNYKPEEYFLRDQQDQLILEGFGKHFSNVIENMEGELNQTVNQILDVIKKLHQEELLDK